MTAFLRTSISALFAGLFVFQTAVAQAESAAPPPDRCSDFGYGVDALADLKPAVDRILAIQPSPDVTAASIVLAHEATFALYRSMTSWRPTRSTCWATPNRTSS